MLPFYQFSGSERSSRVILMTQNGGFSKVSQGEDQVGAKEFQARIRLKKKKTLIFV